MKELHILRKLDLLDHRLVEKATRLVDNTGIAGKNGKGDEIMQENQLRNVIAVAGETKSVAVVENFVRYQIGRHDEWRHKDFGENLLNDLAELRNTGNTLAKELKEEDVNDIGEEELTIRLVRRYLGYLARYFKYAQLKEGGG